MRRIAPANQDAAGSLTRETRDGSFFLACLLGASLVVFRGRSRSLGVARGRSRSLAGSVEVEEGRLAEFPGREAQGTFGPLL